MEIKSSFLRALFTKLIVDLAGKNVNWSCSIFDKNSNMQVIYFFVRKS